MAIESLPDGRQVARVAVDPTTYLNSRTKRATDIAFALFGLVITGLLLIPIALLIKLDSRGPVFYRQKRLGLGGRTFSIVKFRTMIHEAEKGSGAVWASPSDPRLTRVGKVLRKTYLDEFPQWWNVLTGTMAVVGPRPERPEISSVVTREYPGFIHRLHSKPGITGLAQVHYRYANTLTDSKRKLSYDTIYIKNASLILDLKIAVETVARVFRHQGQ